MALKEPSFKDRAKLGRYIDEYNKMSGNRPSPAAFLPDPDDNPLTGHLSVNSLEVESIEVIAEYHRVRAQNGFGDVAISVHNVHTYTDVAKKQGIAFQLDPTTKKLKFLFGDAYHDAFKHRPTVKGTKIPVGSDSHCGVEFSRALDQHLASKFARQMAGKGKFHIIKAK